MNEPTLRSREDYIPLDQCENRSVYRIHSRNLTFGVYNAHRKGFVGIREKFGSRFLFTEYHWDTGSPYGTVKPIEKIMILPRHIPHIEYLPGMIDYVTGREVDHRDTARAGEQTCYKYFFKDNDEPCPEDRELCQPAMVSNFELFQFLEQIEQKHGRPV